jgi:Uma2 family endonuclease
MATQPKTFLTPEQYLALERAAATRSEYHDGEVFAMAGVTVAHSRIVTNLVIEIGIRLRGRDCEVFSNDVRLSVAKSYTYPDVMVVCGKPILADQHLDILTNPVVIIEVLSESTKDYDRAGKFHEYRRIPSFQEYLTVSQTEMLVDHSVRQPDGSWLLREVAPPTSSLSLTSLGIELPLAAIYEKVIFATSA